MNSMNGSEFLISIKNRDADTAKDLQDEDYYIDIIDVLECGDKSDLKFFIEDVYKAGYGESNIGDKLNRFVSELIVGDINTDTIIDGLSLILEIYDNIKLKYTNKECIYQFMQYPECSEVIESLIEMDMDCDYLYMLELSLLYNFDDLSLDLVDKVLDGSFDYNQVLVTVMTCLKTQMDPGCLSILDCSIDKLINVYRCDINSGKCQSDFKFVIQNCLLKSPMSFKYFLKPDLNVKPLENDEFWEIFSKQINNPDEYVQAFQDLKNSGIKFNDGIMVSVLEKAGHQQLIEAYSR